MKVSIFNNLLVKIITHNLVGYMIGIMKNGFNEPQKNVPKKKTDFTEREYDYDKLEMSLLGWNK